MLCLAHLRAEFLSNLIEQLLEPLGPAVGRRAAHGVTLVHRHDAVCRASNVLRGRKIELRRPRVSRLSPVGDYLIFAAKLGDSTLRVAQGMKDDSEIARDEDNGGSQSPLNSDLLTWATRGKALRCCEMLSVETGGCAVSRLKVGRACPTVLPGPLARIEKVLERCVSGSSNRSDNVTRRKCAVELARGWC